MSGTIVVGDLDGNGTLDASEIGDLRWPGMIALEDAAYSNFTVAGQTAPRGGISIRGHVYTDQVSNMIWRYVRFRKNVDARTRPGDESFHEFDALGFHDVENVVIDHVSLAFGTDEALDVDLLGATPGAGASIQYTVLSDSKTGTILGGNGPEAVFSFHNNFYSRITHRFPNVGGDGHFEVFNNLVHNWRFRLVNVHNELSVNHINNAYVAGVRTRDTPDINDIANRIHPGTEGIFDTRIFTAGNFITDVLTDPSADNWSSWRVFIDGGGLSQNDPAPASMQVFEAFPRVAPAAPLRTAAEVMASLPDEVGAFRTLDEDGNIVIYRDDIDRSLIAEYREGDGEGSAYTYSRDGFVHVDVPSNAPYADTDGDGMPDAWESAHGFDPLTADDSGDADGDGYTNIEEFLNEVDG